MTPRPIRNETRLTWSAIWQVIADYKASHGGNSPSYEAIALAIGLGKTAVSFHMGHMARRGLLRRVPGQWGGIELAGEQYIPPPNPLGERA